MGVAGKQTNLSPPTDIDQLITISGMVIRTSQLIPEMQEAFFQCQVCAHTTRVEMDRGRIAEPCVCGRCHTTHSMALIHNRSLFSDKQMVRGHPAPRARLLGTSFCQCLNPQKAKFNLLLRGSLLCFLNGMIQILPFLRHVGLLVDCGLEYV
jgi:hypothetical protein